MQISRRQIVIGLLLAVSIPNEAAGDKQVTIIDTGSTNRPGLEITVDANGTARMESRGAEPQAIRLDTGLCQRFLRTVQAATPLTDLPAARCMKSVSFGSRLFVEYNGQRSPDISCPSQQDSRVEDLKKQATELLGAARAASRPK